MPKHQEIEWKGSWRDEYLKLLCGYANARGGTLFIGKNSSGNVVGSSFCTGHSFKVTIMSSLMSL